MKDPCQAWFYMYSMFCSTVPPKRVYDDGGWEASWCTVRWRFREAGSIVPVQVLRPENQGAQWGNPLEKWATSLGHSSCTQNSDRGKRYPKIPFRTYAHEKENLDQQSGSSLSWSQWDNSEATQHGSSNEAETQFPTRTILHWFSLFSYFTQLHEIIVPHSWPQIHLLSLGLNTCFPRRTQTNTATLVFWYLLFLFCFVLGQK